MSATTWNDEEVFETAEAEAGKQHMLEMLAKRQLDWAHQPAPIQARYSLLGRVVCTPGNLTSIASLVKQGKTAAIGAIAASAMAIDDRDCLGFTSSNPDGKAVVLFDTEQPPDDFWHACARIVRRAGLTDPPDWFLAYCLTGLPAATCRQLVFAGIEQAQKTVGGIHSVLVDGAGDLVPDVNDPAVCNALVAELHGAAITYTCPIVTVIHFNPGTVKTRGHLGSQLERKAESNLRLDKDNETTTIWSEKQRRAAITQSEGPRFRWSDEAGMHVSVENRDTARLSQKAEQAIPQRDDVFHGRPAMRWSELQEAIQKTMGLSERTAEKRINDWRKWHIIEKSVAGLWIPKG